jgi:hypothetical protein
MADVFKCADCRQVKDIPSSGGTGYATYGNDVVCYQCSAARDRANMAADGRATLYLMECRDKGYSLTNWPGTLVIVPFRVRTGRHNIAGKRYDVWFTGPDGKPWHGTQYGDSSQLCRCRRVKD